jgi:SAM-dependent methyltransferase
MISANTVRFVDVNCPVCGGRDSRVLRQSSYPDGITVAEVQAMFSASSDHGLFDRVVKCFCGMIYIAPRLDAALIERGYSSGEDPVFVAQNANRVRTFSGKIRSILSRTGLEPRGKRILDVGCAGGAFLVAAREAGFDVHGIEPSYWLSDYGRKNYGLDVRQGILEPGAFPDASFDVITVWDVIEHVPDPHSLLQTIHAALKPDGYLWLSYPDAGSTAARVLGWKWPFWLSVHLHYYRRDSMRRQLEGAGFDVLYMKPFWQQLQLGYALQRAASAFALARIPQTIVSAVGLSSIPFTYNMGQTLVVAKRKEH